MIRFAKFLDEKQLLEAVVTPETLLEGQPIRQLKS
jgi:hypothetical protein